MSDQIIKWLNYWKHSLADGGRLAVEFKKRPFIEVDHPELRKGYLPIDKVKLLFEKEEIKKNKDLGIVKRDNPDRKPLPELEILISPIVLNPRPEYMQFLKAKDPIYPYWLSAKLLPDGKLQVPNENWLPTIARNVLSVAEYASGDFVFSTVELVDKVTTLVQEGYDDWSEYLEYHKKAFQFLTNQKLDEYEVDEYETLDRCLAFVADEKRQPSVHVTSLYEYLSNADIKHPELLKKIISGSKESNKLPLAQEDYIGVNHLHVGQMSDKFPLSFTQRQALFTILNDSNEKVFAVNGPPGTGKTTLLQSIVANSFVQAAIEGEDAPIILACSTNNQAVTNIIDSFSKSESSLGELGLRWISDFEGFGTYLPNKSKTAEELKGVNYIQGDSGTFDKMDQTDYLPKAESEYLLHFLKYFKKAGHSIEECIEFLQTRIKDLQHNLIETQSIWIEYLKADHLFKSGYQSLEVIRSYYSDEVISIGRIENEIGELSRYQNEILKYFKAESILRKIGCFFKIKSSLANRESELKIIVQDSPISFDDVTFRAQSEILNYLTAQLHLLKSVRKAFEKWLKWIGENDLKSNPFKAEFYDHLDMNVRHQCFWFAVHYWEARWISATKFIENENKGKQGRINYWKRKAMLTPCFVSTFFMAPRYFSYSFTAEDYDDGKPIWQSIPLLELAELLIVDEAGQVTPEVGAATFSLAKQALVVGDVKQIEPVWNITSTIDKENLVKHDIDHVTIKSKQASSGNIMALAQDSTSYKSGLKEVTEKGLMLREHRRCYNEIINYCNEVAYRGVLRPMRGSHSNKGLFKPMLHIQVKGQCNIKWQSRSNSHEADVITKWLLSNKKSIEDFYQKPVEEAVGIITPFTGQKYELSKRIKSAGLKTNLMKIGTVHSLQGAEREIVLFSSVYTNDETLSTMFFDRDNKPNMLNVAVSRAKDSFIVFGDNEILNPKASTPSGILSRFLDVN